MSVKILINPYNTFQFVLSTVAEKVAHIAILVIPNELAT
jgi:hypothetical protein